MNAPDVRLPQHLIEAEQYLLGGLMLAGTAGQTAEARAMIQDTGITAADFWDDGNRRTFEAIRWCAEAGLDADAISVADRLTDTNEADLVGGLTHLVELQNAVGSWKNIRTHARRVRTLADRRKAVADFKAAALAIEAGQPLQEIAADVGRRVAELAAKAAAKSTTPAITKEEWAAARSSPACIVDDYLFVDVGLLPAAGGTGKTTLQLFEAINIVLGTALYGREIKRSGPVVVVTAEDNREMLVARARKIADALGLGEADKAKVRANLIIKYVGGEGFKLTQIVDDVVLPSSRVDALIAEFRDLKPVLLVIDPAVSFGVGESRTNDAEQGLIEAGRRLVAGLGCAVRYVHHTGKQNGRDRAVDQYAGRGGSAFADGARMVAVMAPMTADEFLKETGTQLNDGDNAIRLALPKLSYAPKQADIIIRRRGYHFEHVPAFATSKSTVIEANANAILKLLKMELAAGRRHSRNTLEHESDLKRADVRGALDRLLTDGKVEEREVPGAGQHGRRKYLHPVGSPELLGEASEEIPE